MTTKNNYIWTFLNIELLNLKIKYSLEVLIHPVVLELHADQMFPDSQQHMRVKFEFSGYHN